MKGGACACLLKLQKQMILSKRSGQTRTREPDEEALRNYWTIETNREGCRTAIPVEFPGWFIRQAQRKFENK